MGIPGFQSACWAMRRQKTAYGIRRKKSKKVAARPRVRAAGVRRGMSILRRTFDVILPL